MIRTRRRSLFAFSLQGAAVRSSIATGRSWRLPVYRGLHDPVRRLVDVVEEMTINLEAELGDARTLPRRRDEILQRLVLLENIAA